MSVTIVATPGAANANSYQTQAEVDAYFKARLPLDPPWEDAADKSAAIVMATRVLNAFAQPVRQYMPAGVTGGSQPYYLTRRQWTGRPATTTQSLAWPRIGMFDMNGNAIPDNVIPTALKESHAELAGQLVVEDTTLDNAVKVGGITSVKAGSVSVSFKDMIQTHVLPDAVLLLMPASWFTDELWEPVNFALLDVISS